ncbi:FRRS1 [Bugula neritina]|uniref:FRRS1 n=1 Tax=Bugula neritina TaxID=10212 RepID=A0A7J7KPE3_BUGNE|nr:FRRS1 [Bugula neritina]
MLRTILLGATLLAAVSAYPSGAPSGACDSLIPSHGTSSAQTSTSPYSISVSTPTNVTGGESVTITLSGESDFLGFVLVAETVDANNVRSSVGTFSNYDNNLVQTACVNSDGLTHKSAVTKNNIEITWTAPTGFTGHVSFW